MIEIWNNWHLNLIIGTRGYWLLLLTPQYNKCIDTVHVQNKNCIRISALMLRLHPLKSTEYSIDKLMQPFMKYIKDA